jgi:hypothetical protein
LVMGCIIWVGRICIATRVISNEWSDIILNSMIGSEYVSILRGPCAAVFLYLRVSSL